MKKGKKDSKKQKVVRDEELELESRFDEEPEENRRHREEEAEERDY